MFNLFCSRKVISLLIFILIFTSTLIYLQQRESLDRIGKYQLLELQFEAQSSPQNPFDTYLLKLEVTNPKNEKIFVEGFFDGDGYGGQIGNIWKARICPNILGIWSWRTIVGDANDSGLENLKGQFKCVESGALGGVVTDGQHFRFQDGGFIYLQGNFLDFTNELRTTHTFFSETTSDKMREAIIKRHRDINKANKFNVYLANRGDYQKQSVTPWVGYAKSNDKTNMNLKRWAKYDSYLRTIQENGMFVELWFFADDSNFGNLPKEEKNRLFRYAMARTSAFSHTLYVIALEWIEGWKKDQVINAGRYIQYKNPWKRLLSVHNQSVKKYRKRISERIRQFFWPGTWEFTGQSWATFIATQVGNSGHPSEHPSEVNQLAVSLRDKEFLPHISEEFGMLVIDNDSRIRGNMWANFCGGAAGGGTGSNLGAFMTFLVKSRVPFQRMIAHNMAVEDGGITRFCLAEESHHYVVYSSAKSFELAIKGNNLKSYWFNPRDINSNLEFGGTVSEGRQKFSPPRDGERDWVLYISDSSNLNEGPYYPGTKSEITKHIKKVNF